MVKNFIAEVDATPEMLEAFAILGREKEPPPNTDIPALHRHCWDVLAKAMDQAEANAQAQRSGARLPALPQDEEHREASRDIRL